MANETLNLQALLQLSQIASAAENGYRVRWAAQGDFDNDIVEGVARHFVKDEGMGFLLPTDDVREAFLRVSGTMEHLLPVMDVVKWLNMGALAFEGPRGERVGASV